MNVTNNKYSFGAGDRRRHHWGRPFDLGLLSPGSFLVCTLYQFTVFLSTVVTWVKLLVLKEMVTNHLLVVMSPAQGAAAVLALRIFHGSELLTFASSWYRRLELHLQTWHVIVLENIIVRLRRRILQNYRFSFVNFFFIHLFTGRGNSYPCCWYTQGAYHFRKSLTILKTRVKIIP